MRHSSQMFTIHRRRRSRDSPVLTAIGLAYGNPVYLTPTESTSLNRSLKNLSRVITSTTSTAVQNLVKIRPWGASGQISETTQNNPKCFLFIPPFLRNTPTGQTACQNYTLNGSNDTDSRRDVPFLALVDISAHLGDQIAQKTQLLGRE